MAAAVKLMRRASAAALSVTDGVAGAMSDDDEGSLDTERSIELGAAGLERWWCRGRCCDDRGAGADADAEEEAAEGRRCCDAGVAVALANADLCAAAGERAPSSANEVAEIDGSMGAFDDDDNDNDDAVVAAASA